MFDRKIPSRQAVIALIDQQLDGKSPVAVSKPHHHYGVCELRELLDFIYGPPVHSKDLLDAGDNSKHKNQRYNDVDVSHHYEMYGDFYEKLKEENGG